MMKRIVSIVVSFLMIVGIIMIPANKTEAASYPLVIPKEWEQKVTIGETANIVYTIYHEYKNEKIDVDVYDSDGNKVATSTKSFYNTSYTTEYTLTWNTAGMEPGTYKVVATAHFYTYFDWHTAPNPVTTTLTLVGGSSGNEPSGSSTGGSSKYSNEWVNGKWYDANGNQTYNGTLNWKSDSSGWWVEDTAGWYPTNSWQKIDGNWYYFTSSGYMDYSEYRDGCWLNSNGTCSSVYTHGTWHSDSTGWWYEDNGWYPCNQWLWIDGVNYYFNASGYIS